MDFDIRIYVDWWTGASLFTSNAVPRVSHPVDYVL